MALAELFGPALLTLLQEVKDELRALAPMTEEEAAYQAAMEQHRAKATDAMAEANSLLRAGRHGEANAVLRRYNNGGPKRQPGQHKLELPRNRVLENALVARLLARAVESLTDEGRTELKNDMLRQFAPEERRTPRYTKAELREEERLLQLKHTPEALDRLDEVHKLLGKPPLTKEYRQHHERIHRRQLKEKTNQTTAA